MELEKLRGERRSTQLEETKRAAERERELREKAILVAE